MKGHIHASALALKQLQLDYVWWLVAPQNPLKETRGMADFDTRLTRARDFARHPRIVVTGIEAELGTRFTVDSLRALKHRFPRLPFRLADGKRQSVAAAALAGLAGDFRERCPWRSWHGRAPRLSPARPRQRRVFAPSTLRRAVIFPSCARPPGPCSIPSAIRRARPPCVPVQASRNLRICGNFPFADYIRERRSGSAAARIGTCALSGCLLQPEPDPLNQGADPDTSSTRKA